MGKSVPGGKSLADLICESISLADDIIDFLQKDTIFLQPYAIFPAGNIVDADGQILKIEPGASGLLPYSFSIEDDTREPMVTSLTVIPEDPAPNEDYLVHVTYICSTPSVIVNMHIIGTDGYQNDISCYGIGSYCTLYVPGAEELVLDIVTIRISDPSQGFSFTRQVLVVF